MNKLLSIFLVFITVIACSESSQEINEVAVDEQSHDESQDDAESVKFKYLALGDSYTIGQSVNTKDRWPIQLVNSLDSLVANFDYEEVKIIARTGWTTQELSKAIDKDSVTSDYDLVSLLIGVNNQYRGYPIADYPDEFEKLLNRAIGFAGGRADHVIVLSIPDYGYTPFGESNQEKISREINAYNAINKEISEANGIAYYSITEISRGGLEKPNLVASDQLHPSGEQYGLWVAEILKDEAFLTKIEAMR